MPTGKPPVLPRQVWTRNHYFGKVNWTNSFMFLVFDVAYLILVRWYQAIWLFLFLPFCSVSGCYVGALCGSSGPLVEEVWWPKSWSLSWGMSLGRRGEVPRPVQKPCYLTATWQSWQQSLPVVLNGQNGQSCTCAVIAVLQPQQRHMVPSYVVCHACEKMYTVS